MSNEVPPGPGTIDDAVFVGSRESVVTSAVVDQIK